MNDVTQFLARMEAGDPTAARDLLPLVYDELRKLASQRMSAERPGQTLDATGLVHEAWLRLVGPRDGQHWNGRGHFFGAAAEAMRRILIESARRKRGPQRGGGWRRVELNDDDPANSVRADDELLAVDEVLTRFAEHDPAAAELVKLRYFAGLSMDETADALGMSRATAYRQWSYAKAWMRRALDEQNVDSDR